MSHEVMSCELKSTLRCLFACEGGNPPSPRPPQPTTSPQPACLSPPCPPYPTPTPTPPLPVCLPAQQNLLTDLKPEWKGESINQHDNKDGLRVRVSLPTLNMMDGCLYHCPL